MKENPYLTENRLSKHELCFAADNHNDMIRSSTEQLLRKYRILTKLPQISHIHNLQKSFFDYNMCYDS